MKGIIERIGDKWIVKVANLTIDINASMSLLLAEAEARGAQTCAEAHQMSTQDKIQLERYARILEIVTPDCQPNAY